MNLQTRLVMTFILKDKRKVSLSVDEPKTELIEQTIKTFMDLVVSKNVFEINGSEIEAAVEAKVVKTDTTAYDLVV